MSGSVNLNDPVLTIITCTWRPLPLSFFLYLFNTVPLHSLKHNNQRLSDATKYSQQSEVPNSFVSNPLKHELKICSWQVARHHKILNTRRSAYCVYYWDPTCKVWRGTGHHQMLNTRWSAYCVYYRDIACKVWRGTGHHDILYTRWSAYCVYHRDIACKLKEVLC